MRDWWYGDKRDLVKWGAALIIARKQSISRILYVALYRPDRSDYEISVNETMEPLPVEVLRHFRDIDKIQQLAAEVNLKIDIYKNTFQWDRAFHSRRAFRVDYFDKVANKIKEYSNPVIVFLDPDTGIAPATFGYKHVTRQEIRTTLRSMKSGDVLLSYQHARQGDRDWVNSTRKEFAQAVGPKIPVGTVTCNQIANDVAFFVVDRKNWIELEEDK